MAALDNPSKQILCAVPGAPEASGDVETGIIIFAHGSAMESANVAVREVAIRFAAEGGYPLVEPAFLELGRPDLAGAVGKLAAQGAERIIVVPYFLTLGKHLQRDLPRLVKEAAERHPGVAIETTPPLDGHPSLSTILLDRVREAMDPLQSRE
ncbi:MAG: sirohydrochlorin cobaltochelatase [Acidimicrobiia bacterium]|nr:sirohydrochlorin cobaltochelatase [Acidimicrobiia bacterium]